MFPMMMGQTVLWFLMGGNFSTLDRQDRNPSHWGFLIVHIDFSTLLDKLGRMAFRFGVIKDHQHFVPSITRLSHPLPPLA